MYIVYCSPMGRPSKLKRFAEVATFSNVIAYTDLEMKAKIVDFMKDAPRVILELGCGYGEYAVALAELYPDTRFIGIDIQGERLWKGAKQAIEKKIENVLFARFFINHIAEFIPEQSIDEIWITFPDPQPRKKTAKKRLTSERFLESYKTILKPDGILHLKTDNAPLFNYSLETIEQSGATILSCSDNIDKLSELPEELKIMTRYEKMHRGMGDTIHYLKCQF